MKTCNTSTQAAQLKGELFQYRLENPHNVLEICSLLEDYACRVGDNSLLGFVYFYRGEAYYILNETEAMFENMTKAIPYLSDTAQWELLARVYNMMAIVSINRGHAPVAVDYYLAALKCAKEHDIHSIICSIHINLGYLYMQNEIYAEGQQHFEEAYQIYLKSSDKETQIGRLNMIYTNLITCHMLQGNMDNADLYFERLMAECSPHFNNMDYVYVGCMTARYYHLKKDFSKRDEIITDILSRLKEPLPILDLFDDLYALCLLTLEIENYNAFLQILKELEPEITHTRMRNLERKILELKIQYYRKKGETDNYLLAVARSYTFFQAMEKENATMISNMIQVRTALEYARESQEKIEKENAILTTKSETDSLTGLANRYRMTDVFQQMLDDCIKNQKTLSVEILDIDYFKEYNDNYGHQAGDECIRRVAAILKEMQSDTIFCARYGGDEFIIIYDGLDKEEVLKKAKKLRNDITAQNITHEFSKSAPFVTVSQGICHAVPNPENKNWDFLHVADEYLYMVKKQERNRICSGNLQRTSFSFNPN